MSKIFCRLKALLPMILSRSTSELVVWMISAVPLMPCKRAASNQRWIAQPKRKICAKVISGCRAHVGILEVLIMLYFVGDRDWVKAVLATQNLVQRRLDTPIELAWQDIHLDASSDALPVAHRYQVALVH